MQMWNIEKHNKRSGRTKLVTDPRNLIVESRLPQEKRESRGHCEERIQWILVDW